jgi:hypothetical protein
MVKMFNERQSGGRSPSVIVGSAPAWVPKDTVRPDTGLFANLGGPVIECPQIYAGFWGSHWQNDFGHLVLFSSLNSFLTDLPASQFMNVLSQYGVGAGAGMAGGFFQSHFLPITGEQTIGSIQVWLQLLVDSGHLPEPSPAGSASAMCVIIFMDESIGVHDILGDEDVSTCFPDAAFPYQPAAFGFHYHFTTKAGNPLYYGIIASCSDDCVIEACHFQGCTLQLTQSQLQRVTQVTSHEFAEMCTDPQPDNPAWTSPFFGEIGDICNGCSDTIVVGSHEWTVQKIYSLANDNGQYSGNFCQDSACVSSVPSPLPVAANAHLPRIGALAAYLPGHLIRLLPFPPISIDPETKAASMRERDVRRYVSGLYHPLKSTNLPASMGLHFREIAEMFEQRVRRKHTKTSDKTDSK